MKNLRAARITTDPALQDAFIAHLAQYGNFTAACTELGMNHQTLYRLRRLDAAFAQRWHDALLTEPVFQKPSQPWTHANGQAFLDALAETGNAREAARRVGYGIATVYRIRAKNARFAAAWSDVRRQLCDQVDDKLLDGALNGFETVTTVDGRETLTRRAHPRIMLEVVAKMRADPREQGGGRWIQLTPETVRKARDKLIRQLVAGGGLTTMPEAIEWAEQETIRMKLAAAEEAEMVGAKEVEMVVAEEPEEKLLLRSL